MICKCGKVTSNKKYCSLKCAAEVNCKKPRKKTGKMCECGKPIRARQTRCIECSLPMSFERAQYLLRGYVKECPCQGQKFLYTEEDKPTIGDLHVEFLCKQCLFLMLMSDGFGE